MQDKYEILLMPATIRANYDANGTPTDDPPQDLAAEALWSVMLDTPVDFITLTWESEFSPSDSVSSVQLDGEYVTLPGACDETQE